MPCFFYQTQLCSLRVRAENCNNLRLKHVKHLVQNTVLILCRGSSCYDVRVETLIKDGSTIDKLNPKAIMSRAFLMLVNFVSNGKGWRCPRTSKTSYRVSISRCLSGFLLRTSLASRCDIALVFVASEVYPLMRSVTGPLLTTCRVPVRPHGVPGYPASSVTDRDKQMVEYTAKRRRKSKIDRPIPRYTQSPT